MVFSFDFEQKYFKTKLDYDVKSISKNVNHNNNLLLKIACVTIHLEKKIIHMKTERGKKSMNILRRKGLEYLFLSFFDLKCDMRIFGNKSKKIEKMFLFINEKRK